jgi:hypothetical protein
MKKFTPPKFMFPGGLQVKHTVRQQYDHWFHILHHRADSRDF